MLEQLLKAVTQGQDGRTGGKVGDGWGAGWDEEEREDGPKKQENGRIGGRDAQREETSALRGKLMSYGGNIDEVDEENERVIIQLENSAEASEKVSQILSINQFAGEECHPMILSNIANPLNHLDRLSVLRIRNATSYLREAVLDLSDFIDEQRMAFEELKEELAHQFFNYALKYASASLQNSSKAELGELQATQQRLEGELRAKSSECNKLNKDLLETRSQLQAEQERSRNLSKVNSRRFEEEKPCSKCRLAESQAGQLKEELRQTEQQIEKLLIENESLQEYIFDIEQKIVGVDLEVERRLKEKSKPERRISPIREDNKEVVEQLESEIAVLQQKCRRMESLTLLEDDLRDREKQLMDSELALAKREANLKEDHLRLEDIKGANYQREHEILVAEENLSKKIADFRKKETELSEWEAELTRKMRDVRAPRDNTLANQFPSNDLSLQNSAEELNQSGEISLKSFGKNQPLLDNKGKGSPPSQDQLDFHAAYKSRPNNYEEQEYGSRPHEFTRERQNYPNRPARDQRPQILSKPEGKRFGESAYASKSREHAIEHTGNRYNPQMSNYKDTREASPYRALNDPSRRRGAAYQYPNPKASPNHYRDHSKNSRSTSKSKLVGLAPHASTQLTRGIGQRDNQIGGLGSKLQRLREQIKKEIDSIK